LIKLRGQISIALRLVIQELHLLLRQTSLELPGLALHQLPQDPLALQKLRYAYSMFQIILSFFVIGSISSIFSSTTNDPVIQPLLLAQRHRRVNRIENMKFETHVLKQENYGIYQIVKDKGNSQRGSKVVEESDEGPFSQVDRKLFSTCTRWSVVELSTTSSNYLFNHFQISFCLC
jgi:hypothetical protein